MTDLQLEKAAIKYSKATDIHADIPNAGTYWGDKYVTKVLEELISVKSSTDMCAKYIAGICKANPERDVRVVTIGCGECREEIMTCQMLIGRGHTNVSFRCVDIAGGALERAEISAKAAGVGQQFSFHTGHFEGNSKFDVVIALQSLHHMTNLEELFDQIKYAIGDEGIFLTNDMIGRNGHMLWPEALAIVDRIWERLPEKYKFNNCLGRFEPRYSNWDNSKEENEGIRSQDILPELLERFEFEFFYAAGNIAFTLFGRHFGDNFDPKNPHDREFIDQIARLDHDLIDVGYLKPVLAFACMSNRPGRPQVHYRHWTPDFCARQNDPLFEINKTFRLNLGEAIEFSERLPGADCLSAGWSSAEPCGVWSNAQASRLEIPLSRPVGTEKLRLTLVGFQYKPDGFQVRPVRVKVQGREIGEANFGGHLLGTRFYLLAD